MTARSRCLLLLWSLISFACEDGERASTAPQESPAEATQDAGVEATTPSADRERPIDAGGSFVDAARVQRPSDARVADGRARDAESMHDAQLSTSDAAATLDAWAGQGAADDASVRRDDGGTELTYPVGTMRVEIMARDGRRLPLQLWYPAVEAARAEADAGHAVSEFEPEGQRRALLDRLLARAPEGCASRRMHAAIGAAVESRAAPYPLLVTSHHLEGIRVALFSAAEALAGQGFVVAAPDHESLTLYDRTDDLQTASLLGTVLRYNLDSLNIRARDMEGLLDVLLDPNAQVVPDGIRGRIDAARIGMYGHSMGAMTTGIVAARDQRIRAAAYISAPPAQVDALNLTGAPAVEALRVPALFMLNQEDWPMNTVGNNDAIRTQFAAQRPRAHLVEVRDTGHWSFADDCALIPDFADGCGRGTRSAASTEPYDNLAGPVARQIAAQYLVEFFAAQFLGRPLAALAGAPFSPHEVVRSHAAIEPK